MNEIMVTISCVTFNHAEYIGKCLEGIMNQQCNFKFEVLIHDDASSDDTQKIIREYHEMYPLIIKPILQSKNQYSQGISPSVSFNFSRAKGKYIAICEGDDYWTDTLKLQKQVDFLESNPDYNLVYTDAQYYTQKTGNLELQRTQQIEGFEDLLVKNRIFTLTVCLRKSLLEEYLQTDYLDLKGLPFGDYSIWLFAATRGKLKYMPFISSVYRILNESASHSKDLNKMIDFEEAVNTCRMYFLDKYYKGDKEKMKQKLLGSKAFSIIRMSLVNEREDIFRKYISDLKYIKHYKYKYYLFYSLARINFNAFIKIYKSFVKH
ncbi:glycosyltransferase [Myroides pelagicus]|uniref:Glycosyltransferase n=1 Tax=Myroides pelagicus TaxID=270914 RepID=A0A7K1GHV7_9FLAO|nr:glycosyltransferase [Myroides pelagicus]MTH28458.1 glycosyltransferase [Myroides pelagicus]